MRTLRSAAALTAVAAVALAATSALEGCSVGGGDGGPAPASYALRIDGPDTVSTTQDFIVLVGEGFLPAGSTCPGGCEGLLPPPVFGNLGSYTLTWSNAANGQSGPILLRWICNCGGAAPSWNATIALAPGANRITVTETDRDRTQQASMLVTRP